MNGKQDLVATNSCSLMSQHQRRSSGVATSGAMKQVSEGEQLREYQLKRTDPPNRIESDESDHQRDSSGPRTVHEKNSYLVNTGSGQSRLVDSGDNVDRRVNGDDKDGGGDEGHAPAHCYYVA